MKTLKDVHAQSVHGLESAFKELARTAFLTGARFDQLETGMEKILCENRFILWWENEVYEASLPTQAPGGA